MIVHADSYSVNRHFTEVITGLGTQVLQIWAGSYDFYHHLLWLKYIVEIEEENSFQ